MTNEADIILKMIEEVDPADTDKLDEIDVLVYEYISDIGYRPSTSFPYTRSRDALKAIRPEGWYIKLDIFSVPGKPKWTCECFNLTEGAGCFLSPVLPTEELAELHAIIQAIEWERENDK